MPWQLRFTAEISMTAAGSGMSYKDLPTYWLTNDAFDGNCELTDMLKKAI